MEEKFKTNSISLKKHIKENFRRMEVVETFRSLKEQIEENSWILEVKLKEHVAKIEKLKDEIKTNQTTEMTVRVASVDENIKWFGHKRKQKWSECIWIVSSRQ